MSAANSKRWEEIRAATAQLNAAVGGQQNGDQDLDTGLSFQIVDAAQKILSAAKNPAGLGFEAIGQLTLITANRIFWEWGVFDEIPPEGAISYADLATKVDADVSLITRIGNVLVSSGFLEQTGPGQIAHTPKSLIFTGGNAAGCTYLMAWDNAVGSYATLPQYFREYGRKEPQSQNHVPVTFGNGTPELTYYDILRNDPARRERFMKAMVPLEESAPISGIYDFSWVVAKAQAEPHSDRFLFVDVGGGKGQAIRAIHKEFPGLPLSRCLLQDLAEVIETVKAVEDPTMREVQTMAIDFHRGQPVKGALVYWIRGCLHNYSDTVCVDILKHLAEALAEDSKVLIEEDILDTRPSPVAAVTDMMMINFGGKERTIECWERVTSEAGLRISSVSRGKESWSAVGVLECVKKAA